MNTRIERQKVEISKAEDKLAACKAYCEKFPCTDSQSMCVSLMEELDRAKARLAEMTKEVNREEVSALRRKKWVDAFPKLAYVTGEEKAWDTIDATLSDAKYTTDEERGIALEICLRKLSGQ